MTLKFTDWRQLARLATTETDPAKLMEIVTELNRILGEEEEARLERRTRRDRPIFPRLENSLAVLPNALPAPPAKGGCYDSY